ncbi:uncharacterized protein LOC132717864 [Ruditapes philippinarum]|uniref:uncharacterized protein LOC132717864 n=1 Tax=Ruditapes philippinarum TaxID=129788 RepID=UPI00295AA31C|nr:uncharacterized protein LOC132717864 [Ruditapes philippinarum]XP_060557424.1 uncharacterized protein LOC132717864 [Ruditapes philippinarum]
MEKLHSYSAMCSTHSDEVAIAACVGTKELLCFKCSMEKAKASVPVKELDKMSEGGEKLILDFLMEKQKAQRKNNFIDIYKRKAEGAKNKVSDQIHCFYKELSEQIIKMRDNTLLSLEEKYTLFLEMCNKDEEKLKTTTQMINEHLDKLSSAKGADLDKYKAELDEIMKKLDDIADHESCPEADFHASKKLKDDILMPESKIGEVNLFASDHYEKLGPTEGAENYKNPKETNFEETPPTIPPKPVSKTVGSDEVNYEKPKVIPRKKSSTSNESGWQIPEDNRKSKGDQNESAKEDKEEKPRKKFFRWKSKPAKLEDKLQDYEEVSLKNENQERQARYLVNKTVTLSEFPDGLSTSFKFSKLIPIGLSRIGLLSEKHSSIFVCGLDGKIQCTNNYPKDAVISIIEMTDDMIAVLNKTETSIETVKVTDKRFEVKNTINFKLDISKVTGFDFSKTKSHFAIGTESEYVILDKKGKKIKSIRMETSVDSKDIFSIYDFEKNNVFIINKTTKSLKCFDVQSAEVIWKRKCEDPSFQPESACLYQGKLYIASSRAVIQFSTADGKPERKHETDDLIQNCLGLCVIDNVCAISSNSSDSAESKRLGFLAL